MNFRARLIQFLGETGGTSKSGNVWKKKEWLVETDGQYPRKVKVQCFGEKSDAINLEPGKVYDLHVDLESREFGGRWYTDVSVYRVAPATGNQAPIYENQPQGYGQNYGTPQGGATEGAPYGGSQIGGNQPTFTPSEDSGEDLPF